jgi:UDP-glucose 4-epimerase
MGYTWVDNVVEANLLACTADKAVWEVINIAYGERNTILQLVDTINKILGKNIEPVFEKERVGDVKHSLAGIEKAKRMLGLSVICGFEEGLEKLIESLLWKFSPSPVVTLNLV